MFFELILKTVEKKKLGQSYRFRSDPSNGDLDKGRKKKMSSQEQLNEMVSPYL